jgi:uncharacterized protein (TIGR02246 family)
MRTLFTLTVSMFVIGMMLPSSVDRRADEAAIRAVETRSREAWNRHDPSAYAARYAEDADSVNVVGWWWKGRPEIEQKVAAAHRFIFRNSVLSSDVAAIRFLTPDIAVVHVRWSMIGHLNLDGSRAETRHGVSSEILQKQAGQWMIASFHNTDSIPEMPFPGTPGPQ